MKRKGRNFWTLAGVGILALCAGLFLIEISCASKPYNPALYPSYDVLNPGPEVRINPLGFTDDGNLIVNQAFMLWVYELKQEIVRLRKELKEKSN